MPPSCVCLCVCVFLDEKARARVRCEKKAEHFFGTDLFADLFNTYTQRYTALGTFWAAAN